MRMISPIWTSRNFASDLFKDWDELFARTPGLPSYDEREFVPKTDISETEKQFMLSIDLPGLKKEDIKIEVVDGVLSVTGERKHQEIYNDNKTHRIERSYGSFKRAFTLPKNVSADSIEAQYENGVLELVLPKTALAQSKKIEIQAGKGTQEG